MRTAHTKQQHNTTQHNTSTINQSKPSLYIQQKPGKLIKTPRSTIQTKTITITTTKSNVQVTS
ncbi:hypothetical protein Syun_023682 [Stephania yunnanensis]|uniref:Uncharacterized protein n=1 Tax=Stephania yunnanensis TaxID=152371 RepID=A0AAP0I3G5_9MAGN